MITASDVSGSDIRYCHVPDVFSKIEWIFGFGGAVAFVYERLDGLGWLFG
jgi:hypothetical protein